MDTPSAPASRGAEYGLKLPPVPPLGQPGAASAALELALAAAHPHIGAYGRLEELARRIACLREPQAITQGSPALLLAAADHGVLDNLHPTGSASDSAAALKRLLEPTSPVLTLARRHGARLTAVDAGLATPLSLPPPPEPAQLWVRKVGHGSRNMARGPAMSGEQTLAALRAGMDLVQHTPGPAVALSALGEGAALSASLLLARLCAVPLEDTLPDAAQLPDPAARDRLLRLLFEIHLKHRQAARPMGVLAAVGGFDIAVLVGAMLQAASMQRLILLDGYAAAAAALVARELRPAVSDYLLPSHRSAQQRHRLLLIHLQAEPLLDWQLSAEDGTASLLAWPLLQSAAALATG